MSGRAVAFFDLDRTVMSGASVFHFGKAALRHGMYSRRQILKDAWTHFWFRRRGADDDKSAALRDHVLGAVKGYQRADMDALTPEILAAILQRIFPESHALILEHEREGHPTYLCSASPIEIVSKVADALGMSGGALATEASLDGEGRYTGELVGPFCYGEGKVEAMRAEAERAGLDLGASFAYSDSASDLPMLEAVGHPVVVNPDAPLRAVASERGWTVLRFEPRHGLRVAVASGGVALAGSGVALAVALWRGRKPSPAAAVS